MNDLPLAGAKICVTGGTGFLGSHLLPLLVATGAETTCLVRPQSANRVLPAGIKKVAGDCGSGEGLAEALRGNDIVIHMAGLLFGTGWRNYMEANARASQNIANVLQSERGRLIFVSSLAAAGPCGDAGGLTEDCIPAPVSAYGWSKFLCERIFESALGNRLTTLRPPIIYGSGDRGLLPLFKSAKRGLAISPGVGRKFPVSIIHARDAARAIILASIKQTTGLYHLNDGASHDMDSFCEAMGNALGRKKLFVAHAPLPLMAFTAGLSSLWGTLASAVTKNTGAPHWNFDKYREAREAGWVASSDKIRRELGFEPEVKLEAGMEEAVAGYQARGWL